MPDVPLGVACRDPKLLGAVPFHPRQLDLIDLIGQHQTTVAAAGRRAGKSRIAAASALHSLLLSDRLDRHMPPHETRFAVCIANSEEQAKILLGLALAIVKSSPALRGQLVSEAATDLTFRGGRVLRVLPCNARTIRGLPAGLVVFDELGHFVTDELSGPQVAERIWRALTPSVAQFGNEGRVLAISTPGDENGLFERLFQRAQSGELEGAVAFSASTLEMNPAIDEDFLRAQRAALGEAGFAQEYEARFVAGGSSFFDGEELRQVVGNRREALPDEGTGWVCALDPSSGGGDPFACVVVGRDARAGYEGRLLVGHVEAWQASKRPRRTLSRRTRAERDLWLDSVLDQVAKVAQRFRAKVVSDQHVPGVVQDELQKRGVGYVGVRPWTGPALTEAFQALRARVATERIELVDHEGLVAELARVRSRLRAGSSRVEIPRVAGSHGDLAMALALGVAELDRHGASGPSDWQPAEQAPALTAGIENVLGRDRVDTTRTPRWYDGEPGILGKTF